jgi:predicted RNA-binding Zn-ribbon protein involved in translation (DUF1610 family)
MEYHCQNCGGFVTPDFVRVFGTNDGSVLACPNCASMGSIMDGGAAGRQEVVR